MFVIILHAHQILGSLKSTLGGWGGGDMPKEIVWSLLIKRVRFKSSGKGKERGREGGREGERERGREGEREGGREGGVIFFLCS